MKSKPEKTVTVSLRMPEALSRWLDKKAIESRRSKSAQAIVYLAEIKSKDSK